MYSKNKLVFLEIVILVIAYKFNTVTLNAASNSKSFKKCLEYRKVNGTIIDLIPIDALQQEPVSFIIVGGGQNAKIKQFPFMRPGKVYQWNRKRRALIVAGGQKAKRKQVPFIAALGYEDDNQIKYYCGGTLISERFVLTSAHCIFSRAWGVVKFVRLGDLNLQLDSDNDGVQMFQVEEHYIHPKFKFPAKYHDIALIKLNKSAVFSSKVAPSCLDFSRDVLANNYLYVAGWGQTGHGEKQSDHLQVGRVVEYNISECQRTFPADLTLPNGIDDESQVCAGPGSHLTDTCEGDSGSPLGHLYLLERTKMYFVIGVTSFGKTCLQRNIPAVYIRVSYYTEWIESIVWPEETVDLSDKIIFPTDD